MPVSPNNSASEGAAPGPNKTVQEGGRPGGARLLRRALRMTGFSTSFPAKTPRGGRGGGGEKSSDALVILVSTKVSKSNQQILHLLHLPKPSDRSTGRRRIPPHLPVVPNLRASVGLGAGSSHTEARAARRPAPPEADASGGTAGTGALRLVMVASAAPGRRKESLAPEIPHAKDPHPKQNEGLEGTNPCYRGFNPFSGGSRILRAATMPQKPTRTLQQAVWRPEHRW